MANDELFSVKEQIVIVSGASRGIGRAIVDEDWSGFVSQLLGRPSPLERNPHVVAARQAFDKGDLERALALFPLRHRAEKKATSMLLRTGSPREAFLALGRRPRRIWIAAKMDL